MYVCIPEITYTESAFPEITYMHMYICVDVFPKFLPPPEPPFPRNRRGIRRFRPNRHFNKFPSFQPVSRFATVS